MSFILDALKKSELERQRQTVPGLMDSGPLVRRPRFPLWAIALGALLAVNLAVLLIVLLRGTVHLGATPVIAASASATEPGSLAPAAAAEPASGTAAPAPSAAASLAAPVSVAATPSAAPANGERHFSPMDTAPVYAPEIPATDDRALMRAAREREASQGRAEAEASAAVSRAARAEDPVLTAQADKSEEEALPTAAELDLANRTPLPELHLDVHVYAARPADRFVYINNQKYREGSAVAEGLTLERIRRDGVVLNYNGLRFVLPRQ
jgi:general secretion pathway protein B